MPHGGISGPAGGPRPFCSCEQQIVFEIEGRGEEDIDESGLESRIDSEIIEDVSVKTRPGRFGAGDEIVVVLGGSIVNDNVFRDIESIVNSYTIQNSQFQLVGWRIEGT